MNLKKLKNTIVIVFIGLLQQSFFMKSFLSEPYLQLKEVLPFNDHGWYGNAPYIEKLMKYNKISIFIEVGSWLGLSTRHIASLLQPGGKLYAVDTWQGSEEHFEDKELKSLLPILYEQFLSNMIHAKLTDIVIPLKMTSLQAAPILAQKVSKIDMIYIDAAHDAQSVFNDLQAYWPFVQNNKGILCGDDWKWLSVQAAVKAFASMHHLSIYSIENFWFLKKEYGYILKSLNNAPVNVWQFLNLQ